MQEDPANPLTPQLLDLLRDRSGLPAPAIAAIPAYDGSPLDLLPLIGFSPDLLADATLALPEWRDRMGAVMYLRQQGIDAFVPALVAAVERDPHPDVRMAALKDLGRWGDRADVRVCLERLVSSGDWRQLQPYVAMALRRIHADWAQRLVRQIGAEAES